MSRRNCASLGALTAGIAHEIRNPLNFITNFAELAAQQTHELRGLLPAPAPELGEVLADLEQSVSKVREHGNRASRIVSAMLLHARAQPGERLAADLNALVAEHVALAYHGLRSQDPTFHVVVETNLDPHLTPVTVLPQELGRVILNLTQNACYAAFDKRHSAGPEFTPTVSVSTHSSSEEVELRFLDNGGGVPAKLRETIFTPFFTTKPAGAGTGLGLSISYDIVVRLHHGRIRLESEEGRFAEFIVTLPRTPPPAEAVDRAPAAVN